MKKGKILVFGMLALVLTLGLVLASCATMSGNREPKTIIITGYNLQGRTPVNGIILSSWEPWTEAASGGVELGNNFVGDTITLYLHEPNSSRRFTGNGGYSLIVNVTPAIERGKSGSAYLYNNNGSGVIINEAVTTIEWSHFEHGWDW